MWMNEHEIDEAVAMHRGNTVVAKAARLLSEYRHIVNENSDGWSYWVAGTKPAEKLQQLIKSQDPRGRSTRPPEIVMDDLREAMKPIYAFCKNRNLPRPEEAKNPMALDEVGSKYGAPMGRCSVLPVDLNEPVKFRMVKLKFVGHDYDEGGAYWGLGDPIYFAKGDASEVVVKTYVRAATRAEAKEKIRSLLPQATFYR